MSAPNPPHIVVLGGGSAGWITACLLHHRWGARGGRVTVVESPDIGIIGVGEGSTPQLKAMFGEGGTIESWQDLGIDLGSDNVIQLGSRQNNSGTYECFRDEVLGGSKGRFNSSCIGYACAASPIRAVWPLKTKVSSTPRFLACIMASTTLSPWSP